MLHVLYKVGCACARRGRDDETTRWGMENHEKKKEGRRQEVADGEWRVSVDPLLLCLCVCVCDEGGKVPRRACVMRSACVSV